LTFTLNSQTAPQALTLEQCLLTALQANRELQVERLNPEIARTQLSLANAAYDPLLIGQVTRENASDSGGFDPADFSRDAIYEAESEVARAGITGLLPSGLTYNFDVAYAHSQGSRNALNFDSYNVAAGVSLSQPLLRNLWIDPVRFAIRVGRRDLAISQLRLQYLVMEIVNLVHQAYFELAQAYQHLQVEEQRVVTRRLLLHSTQRQLEEGLATLPDQQLAQSQLAMAEAAATSARMALVLAENNLRTHLGDSFTNQLHVHLVPFDTLQLPPAHSDLASSWHHALAHRPDLLHLREEIAKANLNLQFRRNQLFPSLNIVGGYGRKGASVSQMPPPFSAEASSRDAFNQLADGTAPTDRVGLVFSIPLSLTAERSDYRAGKHLRAQAALRLQQQEELVLREVSDAFHTLRTSLERAHAAARGVEHAQAALAAEERRLAGGKSTLFLVLQLQDQLVNLQASEISASADYNRAISQLNFADATLLQKTGIALSLD